MKIFTCIALLTFSSLSLANTSLPNNRHIAVTGSAEMMAMPDIAIVHLNVESNQQTSLAAKKDVDERVNNLLDGLAEFGVDEANVSASNISTEVRYAYNRGEKDKIEGYIARRTLKVTLKQLDMLNAFMDFALSVKINAIRNVELKSSNETQLQQEANTLAVTNAKNKGKLLANAFDAKLGKIYSINSNSNQIQHRYGANNEGYRMSASLADSPSKPGRYLQENLVFTASISVVFDLEM
ncbi:MAG: SIMPL domain-containing protein [Cognaticolwellia sp.]